MSGPPDNGSGLKGYDKSPDYGGPKLTPGYFIGLALFLAALALLGFGTVFLAKKASAGDFINAGAVRVIDPDTLGFANLPENVRIENVDGPEKGHRAKCKAEKELEALGTNYAKQLLSEAKSVQPVLSDPPKTDRYGRYVGSVLVDGQDYGQLMIAAGYMKAWDYGKEPKPLWCEN